MSHYIELWCSVHGDQEVDTDQASCPKCDLDREQAARAFVAALRGALDGQPADVFANTLDPEQFEIVAAVAALVKERR